MKNINIILLKGARFFPKPIITMGYIIIALGLLTLIAGVIGAGIFIIGVGCFFVFTPEGVQVDVQKKMYRNYGNFLGLKLGKWKSFEEYTHIAILVSRVSETIYGGRSTASITIADKFYDICLLNETHRKKIVIQRLKELKTASEQLKLLANKIGLISTEYNPVVSEQTKVRRAKR